MAALVAASQPVFDTLRYGGSIYLVYLGIREFRSAAWASAQREQDAIDRRRLYRDGVLVDLLNPKSALFFLAFLPQFVQPVRGSESGQVIVLGLCFVAMAVVCDSAYALLAGSFSRRLNSSVTARRVVSRATGSTYIALGALVCFA